MDSPIRGMDKICIFVAGIVGDWLYCEVEKLIMRLISLMSYLILINKKEEYHGGDIFTA